MKNIIPLINHTQKYFDDHLAEIESLKHATEVAREISNKLQKELSDTKLKFAWPLAKGC